MIAPNEIEPRHTTSLADIEGKSLLAANARRLFEDQLNELTAELAAVKKKHIAALKKLAALAATREAELFNLVESAPELFTKPRTVIFHGIKVGFTKSDGKIEWDDDAQVIKLIRKHLKDQEDVLIAKKETPSAAALRNLTAADLQRVGCRLEGAGDVVVFKWADGEIEKAFDKLIAKMVEGMVNDDDARN
jgi:hypothetical protein